jgi:hypothetical protein
MGASPMAGLAVLGLCLQLACQAPARVVQTVLDPLGPDAETSPSSEPPLTGQAPDAPLGSEAPAADGCPDELAARVSVSSVRLEHDVRYKVLGYGGFPFDERVAFAAAPLGGGYVAWTDDTTGRVWVTPLDDSYKRAGPDIDPKGYEVGGIVAHDDGFALLTLRDDPSVQSSAMRDPNIGRMVTLVRFRAGAEVFAVPLTGASSITQRYGQALHDYAPGYLYGRLAWNGTKYGAYFIIQLTGEDPRGPALTDKLAYVDDTGAAVRGGFSGKCMSNQGLRLWPEQDVYTPVCISDSQPAAGINLVAEDRAPLLLAAEASDLGWSGGQLGSIVKLADDSYFVGWLSRDVVPGAPTGQAARTATDIALLRLDADRKVIGDKRWLVESQGVAETNLHFARYGSSQLLAVWDAISAQRCDRMCFGTYAGTFARLLDREGNVIQTGELEAVPNHHDDLVTLANGDVAWAYVPDPTRDFSSVPPSREDRVLAPAKRTINIARLRYCE